MPDANAAVEAFVLAKPATRVAIVERKTETDKMPQLMREGKKILTVLDNLVHLYEEEDLNFVSDYRKARVIVDYGIRDRNGDGEPEVL